MSWNNEALDDEPQIEGSPAFSGGQVSDAAPNVLRPHEAFLLKNMDLSVRGHVQTRRGTSALGTGTVGAGTAFAGGTFVHGAAYFDTSTYHELLMVNNGKVFRYTGVGAGWDLPPGSGIYFGFAQFTSFAQGVDRMYFCDGTNNLFYYDGVTTVNMGNRFIGPPITSPPNAPGAIVWHTSRLVASVLSQAPDTVEFSDLLNPSLWNATTQSLRVGVGDGDPITGIASWIDYNLLVVKRRSLWVVNCDPSMPVANFTIKSIHSKIGSKAPRTFVQVGSDIIGLTDSGVRSMSRTYASDTQQEVGTSLSYPINDFIQRINPAAIHLCTATFRNGRYILSVPLDSSTTCNFNLVLNTVTQTWTGFWTDWNASCFAMRISSSGDLRLVFGTSQGYAREWLDYVQDDAELMSTYQDAGADINSYVVTKAFNFGDQAAPKTGFNMDVDYKNNMYGVSPGSASVYRRPDETADQLVGTLSDISGLSAHAAFDLQAAGQFRSVQFRIDSHAGKLTVRAVRASAFADTLTLQT